jgi:hypothetical protein
MSKYMTRFRLDWTNTVAKHLNIEHSKAEAIFDKYYQDTKLQIYNSVNFKTTDIDSSDFYYLSQLNFILQENGVLFWKYSKKQSVIGKEIVNKMTIRQEFKRLKNHYTDLGDKIQASVYKGMEQRTKIFINSLYGLFGYIASFLYNTDVADSVTTAGRNVIGVASCITELYGGDFKFYIVNAHLKLLEHVLSEDCDKLNKMYTLEPKTSKMCLKSLLGRFYDDYYARSLLEERINNLTQNQRNVLYYKNNLLECLKVPELHKVTEDIIKLALDNNNLILDVDGGHLCNPGKHPLAKDLVKKLNDMLIDLCYGFYYYDGDYIDGVYQENMEYVVRNIQRKKIALMDTDSNVTVLSHEKDYLLNEYKDIIGDRKDDKNFREVFLPLLASSWYIGATQHGFKLYSRNVGIDESLIPMIDLECEMIMEDCQLTIFKKNYIFTTVVHDFLLRNEMETRGVKYKKSDSNKFMAKKVADIVENKIIVPYDKLDYKELFNIMKTDVNEIKNYVTSLDFIKNSKTLTKIKDPSTLAYGEARLKAMRLWKALYPDVEIEVPGVIGNIKIVFTEELLEKIKSEYKHIYDTLYDVALDLHIYAFANKCRSKYEKQGNVLWSEYTPECRAYVNDIFDIVSRYEKKINYLEIKDKILKVYNRYYHSDDTLNKELKKLFNFNPAFEKKVDKYIIEYISRIGIPTDLDKMPEILSIYDGEVMSDDIVSEYEQLLAPLVQTLGIVVLKNKNNNKVATNVLHVF